MSRQWMARTMGGVFRRPRRRAMARKLERRSGLEAGTAKWRLARSGASQKRADVGDGSTRLTAEGGDLRPWRRVTPEGRHGRRGRASGAVGADQKTQRGFPMETLFAAIVGELASRSVFFLMDRYLKSPAPSKEESLRGLQRMLLRLRVTVEEAEGRHITSHAMLQQLNMLRQEMYRGYHVLDTFRRQAHEEEQMAQGHEVSDSLALSKFNPTKRIRFSAGRRHGTGELEQVLDNLGAVITDMIEFVVLLKNYPMMHRQPYSTYMFIEKCMFGRQMEIERVVNFLLHIEHPDADNLCVLPIIGLGKVGKSTLVEYVCCDERVRNHFCRIIFLSESNFREAKSLRDGVIRHRHSSSNEERLLVVIELAGDVDEGACRRLYSASQSSLPHGSKIIVTSRSDRITKFGTTQALRLRYLSREAYWYFFKVLAFGSSNPEEQPKLASLAMWVFDAYFDREMYKELTGPFIDLSNMASFVRDSTVDETKKRGLLEDLRAKFGVTKNQLVLAEVQVILGSRANLFAFRE